jgi:hypothetical protein
MESNKTCRAAGVFVINCISLGYTTTSDLPHT